jgi:hypothetical protein
VPETPSPSRRNGLFPEPLELTPGHLLDLAPRLSPYVPPGSTDITWPAIIIGGLSGANHPQGIGGKAVFDIIIVAARRKNRQSPAPRQK